MFGDSASESSTLWEATGPVNISVCEACMLSTRCTSVALSYKGSEGAHSWALQSNKGENIACGRQSLGRLPRDFRPCGRQRNP